MQSSSTVGVPLQCPTSLDGRGQRFDTGKRGCGVSRLRGNWEAAFARGIAILVQPYRPEGVVSGSCLEREGDVRKVVARHHGSQDAITEIGPYRVDVWVGVDAQARHSNAIERNPDALDVTLGHG